nr:protein DETOXIFICATION 40-like [Tanacetum cinerariifolium]
VVVGCRCQTFVAYVNIGCYYVVGVPLGVLLAFKVNLGAKGIWSGLIGGMTLQTAILLWVTFRTDWNKDVILKKSILEDNFRGEESKRTSESMATQEK